jgi:hypothetical protein
MALTDLQYKLAVTGGAALLVVVATTVSFCGGVTLPAKPPAPVKSGTAQQLMKATSESESVWMDYVEKDAKAAGIATPTPSEMSKVLRYQKSAMTTLALDAEPISLAGLQVRLLKVDQPADTIAVKLVNASTMALAYNITAESSTSSYVCDNVKYAPHNAIIVAAGKSETVSICSFRPGATVALMVETIELPALSQRYLSQLPPALVGIGEKRAKSHVTPDGLPFACSAIPSSSVRGGLANGKIGWRDLIDFYARHRCNTYVFHLSYRAFTKDGERPLPAADPS